LSASLACLAGFDTVKQAMEDEVFSDFVKQLMLKDIAVAIPFPIPADEINKFGSKVLERFRNPFLQHRWINITFQNTMKMRMRNVPVITRYLQLYSSSPEFIATGFAAFILFMKAVKKEGTAYYGLNNGNYYIINDDQASYFFTLWQEEISTELLVARVLSNKDLWGIDLSAYSQFHISVWQMLSAMMRDGVRETIIKWHQTRAMELSS
jgi:tagaturonate reductase